MRPFNSRARTHNRIWQLGNQKRTSFQTETPFHSHAKTQTQDCGRHQSETNERWRDLLNAARRHILTQKSMENDGKKDHGRDGLDRIKLRDQPVRIETIEDLQSSINGKGCKVSFLFSKPAATKKSFRLHKKKPTIRMIYFESSVTHCLLT